MVVKNRRCVSDDASTAVHQESVKIRRVTDHDLPRRLSAIRELGGYHSVPALAAALPRGYGKTNIYNWEAGRDTPSRNQLEVIAAKCRIPVEFFDVDFSRLPELAGKPTAEDRLATLEDELRKLRARFATVEAKLLRTPAEADSTPGQAPPAPRP